MDLKHYGILGQKWGIRRFQELNGTYTAAGRERYGRGNKEDTDSKTSGNKKSDSRRQQSLKDTNGSSNASDNSSAKKDEQSQSDQLKKVLIGAGVVSLLAVGSYLALKHKNDPKTVEEIGAPESWPKNVLLRDADDLTKTLDNQFQTEVKPSLTVEERDSLNFYSSNGYGYINYSLERNADGTDPYLPKGEVEQRIEGMNYYGEETIAEHVRNIDSAFEKAVPCEKDMVLNRRTYFNYIRGMLGDDTTAEELTDSFKNPDKIIGKVLTAKGYTSTTTDPRVNECFGSCNLHILAPKGTKGLFLGNAVATISKEREYLLPRNSKFKIVKVKNFEPNSEHLYFSSLEIFVELLPDND